VRTSSSANATTAPVNATSPGTNQGNQPPVTTKTVTSGPATAGPASFTLLTLSYPEYCTKGSTVTPIMTWEVSGAASIAVSVDQPGQVGGLGTYPTTHAMNMPPIPCNLAKGAALPQHRYDLDTLGLPGSAIHRTLYVNMTVASTPNLTLVPTYIVPSVIGPVITPTVVPTIPTFPTFTVPYPGF
jgi:hypothetical protein